MKFIDTHCHLNDTKLLEQIEDVLKRSQDAGGTFFFNNADSLESLPVILSLKKRFSCCQAVLGIHPEFAVKDDSYQQAAFSYVEEHLSDIKAIGEIGLDYHYDNSEETKARQKAIFIEWIRFAKKHNLPIVVHSRDASQDTFDIIKSELPAKVDLHCYSGSYELYKEYCKLPIDFKIGIGGVVTFKNARVLKDIAIKGNTNTFLTETDCPYLAPVPFRGKINEPTYIPYVIKEIAALRNEDGETLAKKLYQNGEEFYGL